MATNNVCRLDSKYCSSFMNNRVNGIARRGVAKKETFIHLNIQSNLPIATTQGKHKKWPL